MKIAIGCDHGGIVLKNAVNRAIADCGHESCDYGAFTAESVDYPDYAVKVADAVVAGEADLGILMCGTGIGSSIAANKVKGIRCAHVTDAFQAQMCREHNNANIMAIGGRITDADTAYKLVKIYLTSQFQGGRHQTRIDKIAAIEAREAGK